MKKTNFILMFSLVTSMFFTFKVNAQFSLVPNIGVLKLKDIDPQFGFHLAGKYTLKENISLGANIGYYFKSEDGLTLFSMPLTGLFEYSLTSSKFSPYVGADVGLYRIGISGGGETISTSNFGMAPVIGFNYTIAQKISLNSNFKYHYILTDEETTSGIAINAGLVFKF